MVAAKLKLSAVVLCLSLFAKSAVGYLSLLERGPITNAMDSYWQAVPRQLPQGLDPVEVSATTEDAAILQDNGLDIIDNGLDINVVLEAVWGFNPDFDRIPVSATTEDAVSLSAERADSDRIRFQDDAVSAGAGIGMAINLEPTEIILDGVVEDDSDTGGSTGIFEDDNEPRFMTLSGEFGGSGADSKDLLELEQLVPDDAEFTYQYFYNLG